MTGDHKSEDGVFVLAAGKGLSSMGHLILTSVATDTWCLLDWNHMRRWANELFDDAINHDYEGDPNYVTKGDAE